MNFKKHAYRINIFYWIIHLFYDPLYTYFEKINNGSVIVSSFFISVTFYGFGIGLATCIDIKNKEIKYKNIPATLFLVFVPVILVISFIMLTNSQFNFDLIKDIYKVSFALGGIIGGIAWFHKVKTFEIQKKK